MSIAPNKPLLGDLTVGMALPTAKFGPMDRFDYIPIALILRDTNPLHLDRVYAQERGLPDTVQQGPLNQAYLYQFFTNWLHQPWDLVSTDIRFSANVFPDDYLYCGGEIEALEPGEVHDVVHCRVWQKNEDGIPILTGKAAGRLPKHR
jgi:acyl dehydratase